MRRPGRWADRCEKGKASQVHDIYINRQQPWLKIKVEAEAGGQKCSDADFAERLRQQDAKTTRKSHGIDSWSGYGMVKYCCSANWKR